MCIPIPMVRRSGMVIAWLGVTVVIIFGFASFAVDFGRVELAKSQLQAAATAAARAAVVNITAGISTAQNAAYDTAYNNLCDNTNVVLDINNDIEFGNWDDTKGTFTAVGGNARSSANAIRVTAQRTAARGNPIQLTMARAVGMSTFDVKATATAKVSSVGYPFVGLDSVTLSGQGNTDSYDSSLGAYSAAKANKNGTVASNGAITISGSSIVRGDAKSYLVNGVTTSGGGQVTGAKSQLTAKLAYGTPSVPTSAYSAGAVNVGGGTYYVAAGDYYCTSLNIFNKATYYCQGPVRIFVSGPVSISGGYVGTYQNRPQNFQIFVTTNDSVSLNGQADFYGQVYAPLSDVSQGGQADIYGSIIGKTLSFGGTWKGGAHADESLQFLGTPVIVTTQ